MKIRIRHTTSYSYDAPVVYALQQVRLTPRSDPQQQVLNWLVEIEGGKSEVSFPDHYKNHTILVSADADQTELRITASGEVETKDSSGVLGKVYGPSPLWHYKQSTTQTRPGDGIRALAGKIDSSNQLGSLHELSAAILDALPYGSGETFSGTPAEDALAAEHGVCQDHAQIFVAAARLANIPARYVSGYLMMDDQIEQDASHAWAEAHIDGLGWVGFDVSNAISPDERYVKIAIGRDAEEAAPISGMRLGTAMELMIVSLQVQKVVSGQVQQ